MPTNTPRLGLVVTTPGDSIDIERDFASNPQTLDNYPGVYICTVNTRPTTWGAAHKGMLIYETDSALHWRWTGTVFVRAFPMGLLNNPTTARLVADKTFNTTSFAVALQSTFTMPAGGRWVEVTFTYRRLENGSTGGDGLSNVVITRSPGTATLGDWIAYAKTSPYPDPGDYPLGGTFTFPDQPPAGSVTYQVLVRTVHGGVSYLRADATHPATLVVKEI